MSSFRTKETNKPYWWLDSKMATESLEALWACCQHEMGLAAKLQGNWPEKTVEV